VKERRHLEIPRMGWCDVWRVF